jgi:hypothetical protein
MNNRKPYAGKMTKAYLQQLGIEYVSTDGTIVIKNSKQIKISFSDKAKRSYGKVFLHDPVLYASVPKEERTSNSGRVPATDIHVLNYVWNVADKPQGMVIHHRDNDPTNNDISNLECVTQKENLAYEHPDWNTRELKCRLDVPRSFYEDKLARYEARREEAKRNHDAELVHKLGSNISQTRWRLNYYDSHIEEAKAIQAAIAQKEAEKKVYHERAQKKRELKQAVDNTHRYYAEAKNAHGKNDPITLKLRDEWKYAIAEYYAFCAEMKIAE